MKDNNLVLICDTEKEPDMESTLYYLGKMGYRFIGGSRRYDSETPGLTIMRMRGIDIPRMVEDDVNLVDIGLCSGAVMEEVNSSSIKLLDLSYGKREFLVFVNEKYSQTKDIKDLSEKDTKVNTSWPNTSERYCRQQGIIPIISEKNGPCPIIDENTNTIGIEYMQTRELWSDHRIIDRNTSSNGAIIVNPGSYEANHERIDGFVHRFRMALDSEGWRLLKFNVPRGDLKKVKEYLPAMKGPTHANLLGDKGWVAVEAALPSNQVDVVISKLKNTGAMGFLDQEINGVEL